MIRLRLLFCLLLTTALAACTVGAAQLTATPQPPSQVPPTQPPATASPDGSVSATPLPPDSDFGTDPLPSPYGPQPGDEKLQRGEVYIDQTQMVVAESFPPQFFLSISGSLPTPCHQLRLTTQSDANHRVVVNAYSLSDPQAVCIQVLEPFSVNLPLGSLPAGKYEVWLNGQPVGEVDVP